VAEEEHRTVKRASVTLALLTTALAATIWASPVAMAERPPTVASVTKIAAANDQTLIQATCPRGKAPVSGGYQIETDTLALNSAEGIDLDRKRWSLTTNAVEGPARVTSLAYCSPRGRDVKFRSDRIELSTGEAATLTPTCKRDEKVLSGGYAFVSSGLAFGEIKESFRADSRSWSTAAVNVGQNQVLFLAFANCAAKRKVPRLTAVRNSVRFNDEGPTTATASCGRHRYALSGGFRFPNPPELVPLSRRVGTRGWRVTARGISGRDDNLSALVYCAHK
jgi:hypothetical protein